MTGNVDRPVLIALFAYALVAIIVTRGVVADTGLSVFQKVTQSLIIWLIPAFGMSIVLLMQGNNHTRAEMKKLVPFPFYLAAPARQVDGSLSSIAHDDAGGHCAADAADAD